MVNEKIKLVVLDEHTLGYILPSTPNYVQVIHSSILKGAPFELNPSKKLITNRKIRLASENDFNDFKVVFDGYKKSGNYLYKK